MNREFQFDPSAYPRAYPASTAWRVFMGLTGGGLGVGGLLGIWYFGTGHEVRNTTDMVMLVSVSAALLLLGLLAAIATMRARVVLTAEAIELHGGLKTERMRRDEVAGFRIIAAQGFNILWLKPGTAGAKVMKVSMLFKPDEAFMAWFEGIENIDYAEYVKSVEEIAQDAQLGDTPEARLDNLGRSRKIAQLLTYAAYAAAAWVWFYPHPYTLAVLVNAVLPWLAIALCWKYGRSFTIEDPGKNSAQADLTPLLIFPGIVLSLRALLDTQLVDWHALILPSITGTVLMAWVVVRAAPALRQRIGKLLLLSLFLLWYQASALTLANVQADYSQPDQYRTTVLGKRHTTGKGATQYFSVTAWGESDKDNNEVQVSRPLYQATAVGDTVCISRRAGALRMAWYTVGDVRVCK
jgi:hypothetical protein